MRHLLISVLFLFVLGGCSLAKQATGFLGAAQKDIDNIIDKADSAFGGGQDGEDAPEPVPESPPVE